MVEEKGPQAAPEHRGKGKKVAVLVGVLAAVLALVLLIALYGSELFAEEPGYIIDDFGDIDEDNDTEQPEAPASGIVEVGIEGGSSETSRDDIVVGLIEEGFESGNEIAYIFCEELQPGDSVAPMTEGGKYSVSGPVWFVFLDEFPDALYGHEVKYIFVDSFTGETAVYEESFPPDINGEDIFTAAEECGGVSEIYAA